MNMLIQNLSLLGENPMAWGLVGVMFLFSLGAVWTWRRCAGVCLAREISVEEAEAHGRRRVTAGPRMFIAMALGGAAAVAGLQMITRGIEPVPAFGLLLAGVYVIQTEPYRHEGREAALRVIAARGHGEDRLATAVARLKTAYMRLIFASITLTLAAAGVLLAF